MATKGDLSLSQALGGLRIANPDDGEPASSASNEIPTLDPSSLDIPSQYGVHAATSMSSSQLELSMIEQITSSSSQAITEPESSMTGRPIPYSTQPSDAPRGSARIPYSSRDTSSLSSSLPTGTSPSSAYISRESSQRDPSGSYSSQRGPIAGTATPPRRSSRAAGTSGQYGSYHGAVPVPSPGDAPLPTNAEDWKDRGAAVSIRREVDANGRTVMRQIKKGVRDFAFGRILGEGSYSTVYMATDRQTLKEYAIKVLEKRHIIKEKKIKYVSIEKNTLNRLTEHPGIVRLYYTFQDETSLYYVLDMCPGGELLGVLKKTGTFDVECSRFYGAQILDAVDYMHARGVIHRDLKPENLLLDEGMHVKVTDFGTAKLLPDPRERKPQERTQGIPETAMQGGADEEGRAASFVGTAEYVSPELLTQKNACKASDLWAFGCIIYQLLAGRPPFKAASEYLTFQKIVNLEYDFPPGFPPAARDLVERCLVLDPARRLTVEHIKNHEFFDGQAFGKGLWRTKAPRLRPYVPPTQETAIIQLNGYPQSSSPQPIAIARAPPPPSQNPPKPARIITELPPPSQLDIEWSPVLTRNNERILKLGDLMVISTPLANSPHGNKSDDGPKKLSRFFGGNTTKKRQRLVMITSSGRIVLAPSGGEEKKAKQELSLLAPDATWRTQTDAKGQLVWCVDTGGHHYSFEEPKSSSSTDTSSSSADEWVACLEKAKDIALTMNPQGDNGFGEMSSTMSSPASTLGGYAEGFGVGDRIGRNHLSKSQGSLEEGGGTVKRNRFSKRASRNGLGNAF